MAALSPARPYDDLLTVDPVSMYSISSFMFIYSHFYIYICNYHVDSLMPFMLIMLIMLDWFEFWSMKVDMHLVDIARVGNHNFKERFVSNEKVQRLAFQFHKVISFLFALPSGFARRGKDTFPLWKWKGAVMVLPSRYKWQGIRNDYDMTQIMENEWLKDCLTPIFIFQRSKRPRFPSTTKNTTNPWSSSFVWCNREETARINCLTSTGWPLHAQE